MLVLLGRVVICWGHLLFNGPKSAPYIRASLVTCQLTSHENLSDLRWCLAFFVDLIVQFHDLFEPCLDLQYQFTNGLIVKVFEALPTDFVCRGLNGDAAARKSIDDCADSSPIAVV